MFDGELLPHALRAPGVAELAFTVESLAKSPTHSFAKAACERLTLLEGLGVGGDAHLGVLDQHLFLGKPDAPPNLRQLHLWPGELVDVLRAEGFAMGPGAIGENVVTRGLDLLALPLGTVLRFPSGAEARLTGRRTPCRLVDRLGKGLMRRLKGEGGWGERPIAGVMAVIVTGGEVRLGDVGRAMEPDAPRRELPAL